jgi:hypothetical protein
MLDRRLEPRAKTFTGDYDLILNISQLLKIAQSLLIRSILHGRGSRERNRQMTDFSVKC